MSTLNATAPTPGETRRALWPPQWLHEPLLHFAVLGAVLFAVDYALVGRAEDPHAIVIDAAVDAEAQRIFAEARGRQPNGEELYALRRVWLDNEVLYREGLALRLDDGDPAIRERVIFKALSVIDAGLARPPIDDEQLRTWFEERRARYDEPDRYDFEEAVLNGGAGETDVLAFVADLNAGTPGDAQAGLRVFKGRPHDNLLQSYGESFAAELASAEPHVWRAVHSSEGLRAVRLLAVTPHKPASFEELRGVVFQDWTDAVMAEQRSAAVAALAKKYTITVEGAE
jgi:hypothetical protein